MAARCSGVRRRREVARRDHRFTFTAAGGELTTRAHTPRVNLILLTPVQRGAAQIQRMPVDRSPLLPAGDDSAPRIKLVDNMKAALICCVVLYHTAVVYTSADRPESPIPGFSGLMMVLKPVVMPGFCVISGFLSRADLDRRRAMKQWQLATVYVVFQALYFLNNLATYRLAGFPFDALPVQIFYSEVPVVTWFLFALAAWRTLLPVLVLLRAPLRLSLVVAHLALYVDLRMNYQNLLSFLPYFLGGFYLPPSLWALSRGRRRLALGGAFVAATAARSCGRGSRRTPTAGSPPPSAASR